MEIIWAFAFVLLCFMSGHSPRVELFVRRAVLAMSVITALFAMALAIVSMEEWTLIQRIPSGIVAGLLCWGLYVMLEWVLLWVICTVGAVAEAVVKAFKSI